MISIHTTAKVVTGLSHAFCPGLCISIHTTAKVVTEEKYNGRFMVLISIHTTAKVVTQSVQVLRCFAENFNPHHREGGDDVMRMRNGTQ